MKIVKRSGDVVTFDLSKLTKAIMKAIDLFAGLGDFINDIVDKMSVALYAATHSFCHWLMHGFGKAKRKERSYCLQPPVIVLTAFFYSSIKPITISFEEFSGILRNVYLQRTQNRGGSDSDDSENNNLLYIATY